MKTYHIAVVGIGYIGVEHVKAISQNPRTILRVIVGTDANWKRLEALKAEYVASISAPIIRPFYKTKRSTSFISVHPIGCMLIKP